MSIYDNCRIYYKDKLLAFCDRKRANWYLKRNLAEKISDDPLWISLLFEPKSTEVRGEFFLEEKQNICVVCGVKDDLTLHHVVPYAYRRLFPLEIKQHNCYDVVALCVPCHREYEKHADVYKQELIKRLNLDKKKLKEDFIKLKKAQGVARLLIQGHEFVNSDSLLKFLNKDTIDKTDLESILARELKSVDFHSMSEQVIERITDINTFIKEWRQHFVDTMNPRFLPKRWEI